MRRKLSLLAVPVLIVSLAACTGGGSDDPSASPAADASSAPQAACPEPGDLSDAVEVSGDAGAEPTVTFDAPLDVTDVQRTIVSEGDGDEVQPGDVVETSIVVYDAQSGEELQSVGYDGTDPLQLTASEEFYVAGLVAAVNCAPVGSRTVTVASAESLTPTGATAPPSGAAVIVADIGEILPAVDDCTDGEVEFPTVTRTDAGAPVVTIPDVMPPCETQIETLVTGDGPVVADDADVSVNYQGVNWRTGEVFDESYSRGAPTDFNLGQVVPGFTKAIAGQTVGSQVVVVVAPDDGYGPQGGNPQAGIAASDTLVFVIDILSAS